MASLAIVGRLRQMNNAGLQLTVSGGGASLEGQDDGSLCGRSSSVAKATVNGQAVYVLVRLCRATNGEHLDLVFAESLAALETASAAQDQIAAGAASHPAPAEDVADTSALADAGA